MVNKKRTEVKGDDKCVTLRMKPGLTRDEVWRAYMEACREVEEVTEEDFVALMRPVGKLLARPYACDIDNVWESVYRSSRLAEKLRFKKGPSKGQPHYYYLLNMVGVMLGMEDGLFTVGTSVTDVWRILHLDEKYNSGRPSYHLEEDHEKELRRIVRRITARRK